jgi:hypothetical protein
MISVPRIEHIEVVLGQQSASAALMVRPVHFRSNPETEETNRFQARSPAGAGVSIAAAREFDRLAGTLVKHGVEVYAFPGSARSALPDETFPNNWLSTHDDGTVVLYPMLASNRRLERRNDIVDWLRDESGFRVRRIVDLTHFEKSHAFLEGTGSLVLDHVSRVAYACLSPRTHPFALAKFSEMLGYETVTLQADDDTGTPIYHTNVVMSLATEFAVVCTDCIRDEAERDKLLVRIRMSGREPIEIRLEQLRRFAGNILELATPSGPVIAMSERAFGAIGHSQRVVLERYGSLVTADISTIETYGGGSVRCMLAEIRLPSQGA